MLFLLNYTKIVVTINTIFFNLQYVNQSRSQIAALLYIYRSCLLPIEIFHVKLCAIRKLCFNKIFSYKFFFVFNRSFGTNDFCLYQPIHRTKVPGLHLRWQKRLIKGILAICLSTNAWFGNKTADFCGLQYPKCKPHVLKHFDSCCISQGLSSP